MSSVHPRYQLFIKSPPCLDSVTRKSDVVIVRLYMRRCVRYMATIFVSALFFLFSGNRGGISCQDMATASNYNLLYASITILLYTGSVIRIYTDNVRVAYNYFSEPLRGVKKVFFKWISRMYYRMGVCV